MSTFISENNFYFVFLTNFQVSFYKLKETVIGFEKVKIDINELFDKKVKLRPAKSSNLIQNLLLENLDKVINNDMFKPWFNSNLDSIESISFLVAQKIIKTHYIDDFEKQIDILSKTIEIKQKTISKISEDLFAFLVDVNFNKWDSLNNLINFKYSENNFLFNKKWEPEKYIPSFYQKLNELNSYRNRIENKNWEKSEYIDNTRIVKEQFEFFKNEFEKNIYPINVTQIENYPNYEKWLREVKLIIEGNLCDHKISLLGRFRIKIEKQLKIKAEREKTELMIGKLLGLFKPNNELKELKKIVEDWLNKAHHDADDFYKQKINEFTLSKIEKLENKIDELLSKLVLITNKNNKNKEKK
ncbi:hypothetical protein EG856_02795 [Mycoplasmopsis phocirhinis]|uniref:Uncharacterized protein n=1 Tax=Mycoplasmopsis phocirhinis TaxID=142650 RepID=A0A4P6MMS9_9BACT|nr:hypothetical protein [Mycoplasmopsis phocirhinis]QBF34828.1 hypothetical protein EG856_02795 [Mycoplasmopsis phocirhinis]